MAAIRGGMIAGQPESQSLEDSFPSPLTHKQPSLESIEPDCASWFRTNDNRQTGIQGSRFAETLEKGLNTQTSLVVYPESKTISDLRFRVTIPNADYEITIKRLKALLEDEVDEDYLLPTEHAMQTTRRLIEEAYKDDGNHLSRASLSSDGDGGTRIYWTHNHKKLTAIIPATPEEKTHLYFRDGENSWLWTLEGNEPDQSIVNGLAWLSE